MRSFAVNGVPIVIRGGGFSPNLFLHYSAADIAQQIALMKNLGINAIRLEGHLMPADFYRQMDRAGILINAGYPVLRRVAAAVQRARRDPRRLPAAPPVRAGHRPGTAQPPERLQLPVERQRPDPAAGGRVAGRVPAG